MPDQFAFYFNYVHPEPMGKSLPEVVMEKNAAVNPRKERLPGTGEIYREGSQEILIWETENPRSLVNLVPKEIRQRFEDARFEQGELFDIIDETTLFKRLRDEINTPTATDNRMRIKFWMEYDYCQTYHSNALDLKRVVAGICTEQYFKNHYSKNPYKMAWLLCPPPGYMAKANEALEFGLEQLRDILEQPHIVGGRVDTKLGELKMKIVALLEPRVKGVLVQKTMNMHAHVGNTNGVAQAVAQSMLPPTMEELHRRVEILRKQNESMSNGGVFVESKIKEDE